IPKRPDHGVPEDGADVLKERAGGHEIARVQHDGGEEVQEKHIRLHGRGGFLIHSENNPTQQKSNHDEKAAL
ncbi:hypothetical protein DBR06_SOUSAS7210054, partial [Sousa chinensis]